MTMGTERPLKIGITCYPSVGGSGILASALGEELARRGHEAHFISYERPFRLPQGAPRIFYHPVAISSYGLFKYPDYTLPLSVKMAEVSRDCGLDVLHVHYAVPHATAAILAQSMLPPETRPRVVTTLHGTDTTLLGRDAGYGPAIAHALERSDAVTTVSAFLEQETRQLMDIRRPIDVIHNFFGPHVPRRPREQIRRELGVGDEVLIMHSSNLRPFKRIDLLLECAARIRPRSSFKLLILAGADFSPFVGDVGRLELEDRVIVRENVSEIEDYIQAADMGLFTSDMESFCLSILEGMFFGCPSVAAHVGGIPEVVVSGSSGLLVPPGNADSFARAAETLIADPALRASLGAEARRRANELFSADAIVTKYERLYRRVCALPRG
jgi:N-acetyl-alpha-D-glucosaminyl L-malate synthase BshA